MRQLQTIVVTSLVASVASIAVVFTVQAQNKPAYIPPAPAYVPPAGQPGFPSNVVAAAADTHTLDGTGLRAGLYLARAPVPSSPVQGGDSPIVGGWIRGTSSLPGRRIMNISFLAGAEELGGRCSLLASSVQGTTRVFKIRSPKSRMETVNGETNFIIGGGDGASCWTE